MKLTAIVRLGLPALSSMALLGMPAEAATVTPDEQVTALSAPALISPANGATIADFGPSLQWQNPSGTTQYQLQVVPFNNDGPGINLIRGGADEAFSVPPPPNWYGLLPDMSYTWRVRASDAADGLGENDSRWGPWSEPATFRTPGTSSGSIRLVSPASGEQVFSPTPTLAWANSDPSIYYYEVQVSRDPAFGAGAFLYWELRHGGVTSPVNSYTVPAQFPLDGDAIYYWRVRPRVQGDGTPVGWTAPASFRTAPAAALSLTITSPADESSVTVPRVTVTGKTKPGAIVTANSSLATVDSAGNFTASVSLMSGPNEIEVIATDLLGNTVRAAITVTYIPPQ